jgi:fructokinase
MQTPQERPVVDIFGEVLFDCFPDGRRVLGGAPFNVAWHLRAFGAAPRLISAVGDDPDGRRVREAMQAWDMDTSALQTDPVHQTGLVEVSLTAGEPSYEILTDRAFDHIGPVSPGRSGHLLYHGTLARRAPRSAATLAALKHQNPVPCVLDVNLRSPWWSLEDTLALLHEAAWVKLNRDELAIVAGVPLDSDEALTAAAATLVRDYRLDGLVVTLGGDGALGMQASCEAVRVAPAHVREVEDTVGAGDAFAAVLILGLVRSWPLATTLERAQAFAARIVQQRGATAADPGLYRPYLAEWGQTAG